MLNATLIGRGNAWLDSGTQQAPIESPVVATIKKRQRLKIGYSEEIAWRLKWIDDSALERLAHPMAKNTYHTCPLDLLREHCG